MNDSKLLELMIKSKNITALDIKSFFQLNKEETIGVLIQFLEKSLDKFDMVNPENNKFLFYTKDIIDSFYSDLSNKGNSHLPYHLRYKMLSQDLYELNHYCKGTIGKAKDLTMIEELYLAIYYHKDLKKIEDILEESLINEIDDYQLVDNILTSYLNSLRSDESEYTYYKKVMETMIYSNNIDQNVLFYISRYIEDNLKTIMDDFPRRKLNRIRGTEKLLVDIHEKLVSSYRTFDVCSKKKPSTIRPYIFTIDENTTYIREDAISIIKDNDKLYITTYIIDPCDTVFDNPELLNQAIYQWFDCDNNHLFDIDYAKSHFSLEEGKYRKVVAFEYCFDTNNKIEKLNIFEDKIRVNKNYNYDEITTMLNRPNIDNSSIPYLKELYDVVTKLHDNNIYKKKYHLLKQLYYYLSDNPKYNKCKDKNGYMIINELKILTNYSIANLFNKASIPCVYRNNQFIASLEQINQIKDSCNEQDNEVAVYQAIKNLGLDSWYGSENKGHYGLHLDYYVHATTPVRNFFALLNLKILKDIVIERRFDLIDYYQKYIDELMERQNIKIKGRKSGKQKIKYKGMES